VSVFVAEAQLNLKDCVRSDSRRRVVRRDRVSAGRAVCDAFINAAPRVRIGDIFLRRLTRTRTGPYHGHSILTLMRVLRRGERFCGIIWEPDVRPLVLARFRQGMGSQIMLACVR